MGNAQAAIRAYPWDWINGPAGGGNYDEAGFIPNGMTYTPQTSWSEPANYGGTKHMRATLQLGGMPIDWGITEGLLTSFGTAGAPNGYPQLYDTTAGFPWIGFGKYGNYGDGEFASIKVQPQPYSQWRNGANGPDPKDNVCTPLTFPNCSMVGMMEAGGEASFFDHKTQNAGRIYAESVNRAYTRAFLGGGIESLKDVNTAEHSTFDPCSGPGLFEVLLPLGAAVAATAAFQYYGRPELSAVAGTGVAGGATICIFGFVFNYTTGLLEAFNEPTNIHFERATRFLLYPLGGYVGALAGGYVYQQSSQSAGEAPFQYGGAILGAWVLERHYVVPVAHALASASFVGRLLLGAMGALMSGISGLWCRLTVNTDSCTAFDQDSTLMDSRRWDAVSLAAMLTLEVMEREGWAKEDPRTEFVFRGLLTGPSLLEAPVVDADRSMFAQDLVNPMGYLYAGRWMQSMNWTSGVKHDAWYTLFQRNGTIVGWDGTIATGWGDLVNSNLYSCENWDILREGTQKKTFPATKQVKGTFDSWVGNWQTPKSIGKLVAAANIPANLEAMRRIPGWELSSSTLMSFPEWMQSTTPILEQLPEEMAPQMKMDPFSLYVPGDVPIDLFLRRMHAAPNDPNDPDADAKAYYNLLMNSDGNMSVASMATMLQEYFTTSSQCQTGDATWNGRLQSLLLFAQQYQTLDCSEFKQFLTAKWGSYPTAVDSALECIDAAAATINQPIAEAIGAWLIPSCTSGSHVVDFSALPPEVVQSWCT